MNLQTQDLSALTLSMSKGNQLEVELMVKLIGMPTSLSSVKAFGGGQNVIFYKGEIAFSCNSVSLAHIGTLSVVDLVGRPYYEPLLSWTTGGNLLRVEMDLIEEGFAVAIPLS